MNIKKGVDTPELTFYKFDDETELKLPFFEEGISAGFPSPTADFTEQSIDLNKELISNPSATFFARANGDSLKNLRVQTGDILVIDKSIEPQNGALAICSIHNEYTVKRLSLDKDKGWLVPENENYEPIKVDSESDFRIWGVVTYIIIKPDVRLS